MVLVMMMAKLLILLLFNQPLQSLDLLNYHYLERHLANIARGRGGPTTRLRALGGGSA